VFGAAGEFIWDGGGVGALASTAANWEGDAAPGVGSDVQFSIASTKSCTWDIASTGAGHVQVLAAYTNTITLSTNVKWSSFDLLGGHFSTGAGAGYELWVTGQTAISKDLVTSASNTVHCDDTVTINNGGTLGANTNWVFNCDGDLVINTGGIFSAPNAGGTFNMGGDGFTPTGTYTANSGTAIFDYAGTTVMGAAWTAANAITISNGTTISTGTYALTHAGAMSVTGTLTPGTSTITNNGTVTVNAGGTWGGNTAWTGAINAGVTNNGAGAVINLGSGTKTIAASTTLANTTGTLNCNGGSLYGSSASTSALTNAGTWVWATMNIKLLDIQFDATTTVGSITITITDNITVDAFTVSSGDTLACATINKTIAGSATKDITITGTLTSTGTAGNNVVWSGYRAFIINNATPQTATYTTFTGTNGTTWNDGCDLTINTGKAMQCGVCTLTNDKVGMQAKIGRAHV